MDPILWAAFKYFDILDLEVWGFKKIIKKRFVESFKTGQGFSVYLSMIEKKWTLIKKNWKGRYVESRFKIGRDFSISMKVMQKNGLWYTNSYKRERLFHSLKFTQVQFEYYWEILN